MINKAERTRKKQNKGNANSKIEEITEADTD